MGFSLAGLSGRCARLGAVVAIAASLGACSVMPDWLGGDSDTPTATSDDTTPAPDQSADANSQFPDLADTPSRPAAPSTPDDQKKVADSLSAAGAQQNYSADALRAGQEAAAPPPGAAPSKEELAEVDTGSKSSTSSDTDDDTDTTATADNTAAPATTPPPSTPASAPTTAVASAAIAPPPGSTPAVPAVPAGSTVPGAQSVAMSDAALGFQPSKAPPLDASVAQFVPQPIMSRYQQTASMGGAAGLSSAGYANGPAVPAVSGPAVAMGGPEHMTGAVVANYDAFQNSAVPAVAYSNAGGLPPAAVIAFPESRTILSAEAKAQVQAAAQSFNARGATGYIRVVGHAAVASTKISEARRLEINFERSQARATAVMRELIKDGVPANKILVDAVGDSQPVYNASMPGENGNRRAEIFFQG
jgi:outer membrane protein OmpA-like peptidoglycan-associated protein